MIAVRKLVERRRRGGAQLDDSVLENLAAAELGPELTMLRLRYRDELTAASRRHRRTRLVAPAAAPPALPRRPGHRSALRAARHRPRTAARRLAGIREALAASVRGRLMAKLGVGVGTLDSIVRLVGSELELGLDCYL